jgi:carbon monoxide dehydrogenase subunit G
VKIAGTAAVPASQERAWALLQDPAVLARCMPGCEALDPVGEGEYAMRMKMALASMSGLFQGKVRVAGTNPCTSFRLIVEGAGKIGFMKGEGVLTLAANSPTTVSYEGDVQVGGTIASVGQRLVETTAKMLIKRFFEKLGAEAGATGVEKPA